MGETAMETENLKLMQEIKELNKHMHELEIKYEHKVNAILEDQQHKNQNQNSNCSRNTDEVLLALQILHKQNNAQEDSYLLELGYLLFKFGNTIRHVIAISKGTSPQQTISNIASLLQILGIGSISQKIDKATGLDGAKIKLLGCEIPCSLTALGALTTNTLIITSNPAQWAASKFADFLATKLITKYKIQNKDIASAIRDDCSSAVQKGLEIVEERTNDKKAKNVSKPIDLKLIKQVEELISRELPNVLETTGISAQAQKGAVASGNKVMDIIDVIKELRIQESELQELVDKLGPDHQSLDITCIYNRYLVSDIIEEVQEYFSIALYEESEVPTQILAEIISKIFVSRFDISDQQRNNIRNEIMFKIVNERVKITDCKVTRKVIGRHIIALQNESNMQNRCKICQDANKIIKEVREYEKTCIEKKNEADYDKEKKFKEVWAKKVSEKFVSSFNISKRQRIYFQDYMMRKLYNKRDTKAYKNAMKEAIVKYKFILQNTLKMQLDDVKCTVTKMQHLSAGAKLQDKILKEKDGTIKTNRGNIQLTISQQELTKYLENWLNQYLKENKYFDSNFYDENYKVFINDRIRIFRDAVGSFKLLAPIKIEVVTRYSITPLHADVYFNVHLADSTLDKALCIDIIDVTYKLTEKPFVHLMGMRMGIRKYAVKRIEKLDHIIKAAIKTIQMAINGFLLKDTILNKFKEYISEGVSVKSGDIDIRPRVDSSNHSIFDVDLNANFQYKFSIDVWKEDVFEGYNIFGCHFEKLLDIKVVNGRVMFEMPVSGAINGITVGSFALSYNPEEKCFAFTDLKIASKNFSFPLLLLRCICNWLSDVLLGTLVDYVNNSLVNIVLHVIDYVQQQVQKSIPGTLVIDADSVEIKKVDCTNNITVDISLRSNNSSPNIPEMFDDDASLTGLVESMDI